jgi:hypothetical protein
MTGLESLLNDAACGPTSVQTKAVLAPRDPQAPVAA